MKLATLILPLALLVCAPLHAVEQNRGEKLVELLDVKGVGIAAAKAALDPTLERLRAMGIPAEGIQEISDAAATFYAKSLGSPEMLAAMARAYEQRFTPEELDELIRFYGSPLGRKATQVMPEISREIVSRNQESTKANSAELQAKIREVIAKYRPQQGAPAKEEERSLLDRKRR
ncbi:DUF2059 domain-containing protein [Luteolibacter sp. LG18]|uniref:DUF2059 domain-containing protein n=1 Tax=Luteolibacter sp. LG18 TaxID=2819286 RepID=UPI002B2E5C4A|nr:hypothetical protein llg_09680 [Luteolibacter sp. LG18]